MPLTTEQLAALDGLFTGDDAPLQGATAEDVADGLKAKAAPIWTQVFNFGRQSAGGEVSKKEKKLAKQLDEATTRVQALEDERGKGNPDIEKIRKDAQEEVGKLRQQIKDLEEQHERETEERELNRVIDQFGALLEDAAVGSVRKAWVRNLKLDPELRKRIRVKDGEVVVMQAGKEIPIAADDDTPEAMLKALALETRKRMEKDDPDAIKVDVDTGAGVMSGGAGGEQGYDARKEGKEMAERQKAGRDRDKNLAFT